MKNLRLKNCIAIKGLLFAALLMFGSAAWAQVAGVVVHLSGPLMAKKADGTVKVLAVKSEVENGDTLVSEKNTYAMVKFIDNSEITLRPDTTFHIEKFAFDTDKPDGDSAAFSLVKGGLRSITGLLGKRNKEKFALKTPSATIGIRGTTFIAHFVPPPPIASSPVSLPLPSGPQGKSPAITGSNVPLAPPGSGSIPVGKGPSGSLPPPSGPPLLPPGLHLQVTDGAIIVTNNGGSLGFQAGQFGYVPNLTQPPVIVPNNPGIIFVPPPTFNSGSGGPTTSTGPGQATDCIVR